MTATLFRLQELLYNTEASFLENAQSVASNTYANRVPIISATCTLEQPRETDQTVQSRKNVSRPGFLGLRTGTLEFVTYWPGLTTDPGVGTATSNFCTDLMTYGLGGSNLTDDGGTISSATNGASFVTTGATTITPGTIIRVGAKNDGRADGQAGAVSTWSAGTTAMLTAFPGTPNAADAVRVTANVFPTETNPTQTVRFLFGLTDTGAQFHCMGCQLESFSDDIDIAGARPIRRTWRYRIAYWDRSSVSIPSSVAMPNADTAVIAGGSLFVNTFGTSTRAIEECGSLTLTLDMGLVAQMGPRASQEPYGNITGWVSNGCVPTLTWTIPYSTTPASDFDTDGSTTTFKHALFTANATTGRCMGFYLPRMYPIGAKPTYTNLNGLTYVSKTMRGTESTTTTSELTRSAIRFWMG
jgi:hypothetical protein